MIARALLTSCFQRKVHDRILSIVIAVQKYLSSVADDDKTTTYLTSELLPYASEESVHKCLMALAAVSSVSLLLKLLTKSDSLLCQLEDRTSPAARCFIQAQAEVLSTAFAAVFSKYSQMPVDEGLRPLW